MNQKHFLYIHTKCQTGESSLGRVVIGRQDVGGGTLRSLQLKLLPPVFLLFDSNLITRITSY